MEVNIIFLFHLIEKHNFCHFFEDYLYFILLMRGSLWTANIKEMPNFLFLNKFYIGIQLDFIDDSLLMIISDMPLDNFFLIKLF